MTRGFVQNKCEVCVLRNMGGNVFDFTLVLSTGANHAHYKLIKVLNPTVELWVLPGCVVCDTVREFFEQQPGLTLRVRRGAKRGARPPAKRSKALSADYPAATYTWNRESHPVPLPKLHDGAQPSTLARRLHDAFYRKARRCASTKRTCTRRSSSGTCGSATRRRSPCSGRWARGKRWAPRR